MNEDEFLQGCVLGNEDLIRSALDLPFASIRELAFSVDLEGRNSLHLALLCGHWRLATFLVWTLRVSPHKLTHSGESVYHSIARGLAVKDPTREDFAEVERMNTKSWSAKHSNVVLEVAEMKAARPHLQAPLPLINTTAETVAGEVFGNPTLTLAKYFLLKYHVVLNQRNIDGDSPADLARKLNLPGLEAYYLAEMQPSKEKQRLILGLNDNLIKKLLSFL